MSSKAYLGNPSKTSEILNKFGLTVAEVAYRVGFNNPRYFSKYFKEMYGMMPSEYKNTVG